MNSVLSRPAGSSLLTVVVLVLLPPLFFYSAIAGDVALVQGDGWTQNFGVRVLIGKMIAAGEWPLWNPYIFAGTPLLASIYPGALYPPNWIFALLRPGAAMTCLVITTYHLALIGAYLYARRIGSTRIGALIAGIAFAFGGYMLAHLGHTSRIAAAAWLPWILLAIEHLYLEARWRWVALGSIFIALQLFAGEPQMTFYTVLLGGAYWLFTFLFRAPKSRWRFVFVSAATAVCGALLSMVQLLPEKELLGQSERAQITYEYFSGYSLPPQHLLGLIFPYFFGGGMTAPYRTEYWGAWNLNEMCGYAGLMTILLALVAVCGRGQQQRRRLVWFWAVSAVIALILALGSHLPFELNRALYGAPVYSLFRVSARHLFEFTFSVGVLAGLGATWLAQAEGAARRRAVMWAGLIFVVLVGGTAAAFRWGGDFIAAGAARRSGSESLLNAESLIPIVFAVLSLAVLLAYARWRHRLLGTALLLVLIADIFAYGQSFNWRIITLNIDEEIKDPPTVAYIKEREPNLDSFRVLSYSLWPFGYNFRMLDHPNVSHARGLQRADGYDALRLVRTSEIAGEMTLDGVIEDTDVFNGAHRGLDLLGVKYLMRERLLGEGVFIDGIGFNNRSIEWRLGPGLSRRARPGGVEATRLGIVSTMAHAVHIPDGTPVARIRLYTTGGQVIEREIQVGRDTAEWAFDQPAVQRTIRHRRPRVAESWDGGGFPAHRYLARYDFERDEIDRIEFDYLREDGDLVIVRATLYDPGAGVSTALDTFDPDPQRWKKLESFGQVDVYENLRARPRAWFVGKALALPGKEVLQAVRTGRLPDGSVFDPAQTALFETEDFGGRKVTLPTVGDPAGSEVRVVDYGPHRIGISARNPEPGFLVLSEIYYRGWEAWVDGRRVPVEKVDYALRGVAVPAGEHRVEFVFRAHSFRTGAVYSGVGVLLLLVGAVGWRRRRENAEHAE